MRRKKFFNTIIDWDPEAIEYLMASGYICGNDKEYEKDILITPETIIITNGETKKFYVKYDWNNNTNIEHCYKFIDVSDQWRALVNYGTKNKFGQVFENLENNKVFFVGGMLDYNIYFKDKEHYKKATYPQVKQFATQLNLF